MHSPELLKEAATGAAWIERAVLADDDCAWPLVECCARYGFDRDTLLAALAHLVADFTAQGLGRPVASVSGRVGHA